MVSIGQKVIAPTVTQPDNQLNIAANNNMPGQPSSDTFESSSKHIPEKQSGIINNLKNCFANIINVLFPNKSKSDKPISANKPIDSTPEENIDGSITYINEKTPEGKLSINDGLKWSSEALKPLDKNRDKHISPDEAGPLGNAIVPNGNFTAADNLALAMYEDLNQDGIVTTEEMDSSMNTFLADQDKGREQINNFKSNLNLYDKSKALNLDYSD